MGIWGVIWYKMGIIFCRQECYNCVGWWGETCQRTKSSRKLLIVLFKLWTIACQNNIYFRNCHASILISSFINDHYLKIFRQIVVISHFIVIIIWSNNDVLLPDMMTWYLNWFNDENFHSFSPQHSIHSTPPTHSWFRHWPPTHRRTFFATKCQEWWEPHKCQPWPHLPSRESSYDPGGPNTRSGFQALLSDIL